MRLQCWPKSQVTLANLALSEDINIDNHDLDIIE